MTPRELAKRACQDFEQRTDDCNLKLLGITEAAIVLGMQVEREECAKIADAEEEFDGPPPADVASALAGMDLRRS